MRRPIMAKVPATQITKGRDRCTPTSTRLMTSPCQLIPGQGLTLDANTVCVSLCLGYIPFSFLYVSLHPLLTDAVFFFGLPG